MRTRASKVGLADIFSPADFAHVNWLAGNAVSLLAGRRRNTDGDDPPDDCRHCEGRACDACTHDRSVKILPDDGLYLISNGLAAFDADSSDDEYRRGIQPPVAALDEAARRVLTRATDATRDVDDADRESARRGALRETLSSAFSLADVVRNEESRQPGRRGSLSSGLQPGGRTLEYIPERDEPVARNLVQFQGDRIWFFRFRRTKRTDSRGNEYDVDEGAIKADNGVDIEATRNVNGPANLNANSHGFTFARGRVSIEPEQVPRLLKNDGYCEISDASRIRPGDVVVYWDGGRAVHSARVYAIEGGTVMVEGKHGEDSHTRRTTVKRQWPPDFEPDATATPRFYTKGCARVRLRG
jgi:hypothetical protein